MLILALDTTGAVCSAALSEDKRIIAEFYLHHQKTHSEELLPMVDAVLKAARADIADVGLFACVTGPGSFTGIRIGVATVKGFAQAGNKPCTAVNTLDCLAQFGALFQGLVCPLMDARRAEVYNALYDNTQGLVQRKTEYRALPLADVLRETAGMRTLFLGDGALAYRREIQEKMGEYACFAPENMLLQHASAACLLASEAYEKCETVTAHELAPFYLRKPQAERMYEKLSPG